MAHYPTLLSTSLIIPLFLCVQSHIDDEYAGSGGKEPKVCLTTSRDPSSRLRSFAVEMKLVFPNSARINRGNTTTKEILDAARGADFTDVILLTETRGEPDGLIISHLPYGPTLHCSLSGTVLRHDIEGRGTVSEAAPHLIFHNFSTQLGERIRCILQHLFPVPKPDAKRVLTFGNDNDFISFRHHTYAKGEGAAPGDMLRPQDVVLSEVGPRFELRPFRITLGTLDQPDAETEWVLRPYMNTSRKKQAL